jgi:hypothetical protein
MTYKPLVVVYVAKPVYGLVCSKKQCDVRWNKFQLVM